MTKWVVIAAILGGVPAAAQLSPEEAAKRMQERTAARAVDELPKLRAELARRDAEVDALRTRVDGLRARVAELEAELAAARRGAAQAPAANAAAPAKAPAEAVAKGRPIATLGDAQVTLLDYGVGKVPLRGLNGPTQSADALLWVKIRVSNTSQTKKVDYSTWRGAQVSFERDFASARDNFDNRLKRIDFGLMTKVAGAVQESESIYPGKSVDDVLVFEPPVDGAGTVTLELPRKNLGAEGDPLAVGLRLK